MTSRFKALNRDSSEESEGESDAPTKEALEETASSLYLEALKLQGRKEWDDAQDIYQQLLVSEVLSKVSGRVTFNNRRIKPSLEHLKYCCYQNLGHVLVAKNQLPQSLEIYKKALELDDTDINLWYKIGLVGMKIGDLDVTISAFEHVLEINPRHFPSLDNIVTATYAQGGLLTCLHYIARVLQYDPKFKKALALKDRIFKDHPSIKEHYILFNPYPEHQLDPAEVSGVEDDSFFEEVLRLRAVRSTQGLRCGPPATPPYTLPCRPVTWVQLCLLLSATHTQFIEEAPDMYFFRTVNLLSERQFRDVDMDMEVATETDIQSPDEEVDKINSEATNEPDENEPVVCAGVRGKRRRSSPTALEQWMSGKRRSTRVRNTTRKEEPTLARTLTHLLPSSLLPQSDESKKEEVVRWNEDSMDTMDMYRLFETKDDLAGASRELELTNCLGDDERAKIQREEGYFGSKRESGDVSEFLQSHTNSDVLTQIEELVMTLSTRWQLHWPVALPPLYVQLYKIYLQHNPPSMSVPSLLKSEAEGAACVLYGELLLDQWLRQGKLRGKPSPLSGSCMGGEFPSLLCGDLHDLRTASADPVFVARSLWMHAMLSLYDNHVDGAIHKLSTLEHNEQLEKVDVRLMNVTTHLIINQTTVRAMLSTLNRKQMVDELADLYQRDDFEQIVAILTEVLAPGRACGNLFQPSLDRDAQYELLLYTLWRLDRVEECLKWAEGFVHEGVVQLLAAVAEDNGEQRSKWLNTINNTVLCILTCVNYSSCSNLLEVLEKDKLGRLVQSLIHVICRQIESGQLTECEFDVISPWMLLYEIITQSEKSETQVGTTAEERLPCSIRLLFIAHEYLGRRTWCCLDEAVILYQTLFRLQGLMVKCVTDSEEYGVLSQQLEQIFYCLYGHPMKRNKPRYVQEHSVNGLELTWTRSYQVVGLLRPKELPTYDSSSRCSITADTEALFRRIVDLVPPDINPNRLTEQMNKYIEGVEDKVPRNEKPLPPEMADIYYLIADHYFKNKTWNKALRYYVLDVCNNPERVDSWACLALARGSILETKLNSCDPLKSEMDFIKKAQMSCRCYKTSLELDSGLPTLWIEYGSFSYMVHSFSSRLLKQEQNLSLDMFEFLENQKESMLQSALTCFTSANKLWYTEDGLEMQDERWLHHYMLGKIAEKDQEDTNQILNHYQKSMEFLHLNNASYPDLVTYNTPQLYAVESLELYYRIHAVMVKILEQSEDRPLSADLRKLFRDTLDKVAAAPFARKVTRSEESECGNGTNKTIYIDSEETRIATVKRVVNSMIEKVEAELDYEHPNEPVTQKRTSTSFNEQPAKRVKREDSEASDKSKASNKSKASSSSKESSKSKEGKKVGKGKRTSTESSSDSDSDSESSSSDTSSSNSSEDSDSSEEEEHANGKIDETKERNDRGNWIKEQQVLMSDCLAAMEECACRFPEHFKSRYRLAHYYFRSKLQRNVEKAHQLLLGPQGLFAERKPSNFFNGVWRIPSNEIDRPGSFASHMSRTVLLLVDILRETRDHKMLFDLALRLRDTPESDKKYLRDPEREELSREAFKLSVQALRTKVALAKNSVDRKAVLLEVFKTFKRCAKLWDQKQGPLITLLNEAYSQYNTEDSNSGFDAAVKFCTQELTAQKAAVASQKSAVAATTIATVTPAPTPAPALQPHTTSNVIQAVPTAPTLVPPMPTSLARPPPMRMAIPARRGRGRPPGGGLLRQIFKPPRTSPGHLAKYKYYQDQLTVQMQQLKANTDLMTLRMMNDPKYQAACRESQMLQQMVQLQAMSAKRSESTSSSLSAADSLLAPAKVSVFSAQNVLLPSQLPKQRDVTISSVPNNPSISCQRAVRPQYAQRKNQKQTVTKLSPFQLKTAMASNTNITQTQSSLQHKLLSAKMAKPSTPSSMTSVLKSNNELTITVSSSPDKSKPALSQSETTTALSSRGVSITPSTRLPNVKPANELSLFTTKQKTAAQLKPPEIKIPKDITIGRSLSFSPVTSKSLSPSTSKEVTVTILKSSSDAKGSKSNSPVNVSLFDSGKRTQISPGGRNSPSAVLRTGALTIMPAKPNQTVTARPIPKADFSISLKKDEDATKKDKSSVIVID